MNITVIGSGAMGSLIGGLLAEDGNSVTLIDTWRKHVRKINTDGLKISTPGGEKRTVKVNASTEHSSVKNTDLAIIFVKSTQTKKALEDSSMILSEDVEVLTLQNGLGNPEAIAEYVPRENIIAGVTTHGSTLKEPGHVIHAGEGSTTVGRYFVENNGSVFEIAQTLSSAGIETSVSDRIQDLIWEKVLVNIGINLPTALARVRNGILVETEFGNQIIENLVKEALKVAREEGVNIRDDIISYVKDVARKTGSNKSSMLQDVEAGRKTEVEYLSGSIIELAEKHGIKVPINRVLTNLIRLTEPDD